MISFFCCNLCAMRRIHHVGFSHTFASNNFARKFYRIPGNSFLSKSEKNPWNRGVWFMQNLEHSAVLLVTSSRWFMVIWTFLSPFSVPSTSPGLLNESRIHLWDCFIIPWPTASDDSRYYYRKSYRYKNDKGERRYKEAINELHNSERNTIRIDFADLFTYSSTLACAVELQFYRYGISYCSPCLGGIKLGFCLIHLILSICFN